MLEKFKIKNEYLLIAGTLLLLIVAYRLAFARTIEAWQLHNRLQKRVQQSGDVSYQPGYLERRNHNFNKILRLYQADTINYRSNILSVIALIAQGEDVKLSEVPSVDPSYHTDGSLLEKLRFEGDYFSLLKVLNRLQSTGNIGIIRSAAIMAIKMPSSHNESRKVVMDVYFVVATTG